MKALAWIQDTGISDLLDIAFVSFLLYMMLVWIRKTRAAFVLTGIVIIGAVYLAARQFNLGLTAAIFQGFFAVILIAVVVIFQEELKHFFEQVALWSLNPRLRGRGILRLIPENVETLARALSDLARERIGALVVLQGKDLVAGHLDGGTELGGRLSEALLKSIFDPHSIGHDGAILVAHNRLERFGTHLPLSKNLAKLPRGGTRHAAALGLSELTDALCLVVSEERGTISACRYGDIRVIPTLQQLTDVIEAFYREVSPARERRTARNFFLKNYREKILSAVMAVLLWFVFINGSKQVYRSFTIPVEYAAPPNEMRVTSIDPAQVEVTFSGQRRLFYFLGTKSIRLFVKPWKLREGKHAVKISPADVEFPKNLQLENIEPKQINATIEGISEEKP